jgi:hypothetical protein
MDVQVGLEHFAAIGGMTEAEFSRKMFEHLENGTLLALLKDVAIDDLLDWIGKSEDDDEFVVVFRLSLNRGRDVALFCVCSMSMTEDWMVDVRHAIPGFIDNPPAETDGLQGFEFSFCDMEATI